MSKLAKNWALAMMLKALPLVHFWSILLLKEQMMTSVRKTLKMLVWSAQNQSISSEICPKNNHKFCHFLPIAFRPSLPWKFPQSSCEIGRFFCDLVPKNPAKFDFFPVTYQKSCTLEILHFDFPGATVTEVQRGSKPTSKGQEVFDQLIWKFHE